MRLQSRLLFDMSRYIFIFVCFLLFFLFPFVSPSQPAAPHVPRLVSHNYKKLTTYLTKGIPDDSVKVSKIFLWITDNIKYDGKAYLLAGNRGYSLRRILRRRKVL